MMDRDASGPHILCIMRQCSPCLSLMTRDPWGWEPRFPRPGHTPGCQQAISSYHVTSDKRDTEHDQRYPLTQIWEWISNLFVTRLRYYFLVVISVIIAVFSISNYRWLICFVSGRAGSGRGCCERIWATSVLSLIDKTPGT